MPNLKVVSPVEAVDPIAPRFILKRGDTTLGDWSGEPEYLVLNVVSHETGATACVATLTWSSSETFVVSLDQIDHGALTLCDEVELTAHIMLALSNAMSSDLELYSDAFAYWDGDEAVGERELMIY